MFGSTTIVLSSASSKTSIGLAFLLHQANKSNTTKLSSKIEVIGLTSTRNVAFVQKLGIYDQVIDYTKIEEELANTSDHPTSFVDMAGNTEVLVRLHEHLGIYYPKL